MTNIVFSNVVKKSMIERLAEVDQHEVVREVQASHRYRLRTAWITIE